MADCSEFLHKFQDTQSRSPKNRQTWLIIQQRHAHEAPRESPRFADSKWRSKFEMAFHLLARRDLVVPYSKECLERSETPTVRALFEWVTSNPARYDRV